MNKVNGTCEGGCACGYLRYKNDFEKIWTSENDEFRKFLLAKASDN